MTPRLIVGLVGIIAGCVLLALDVTNPAVLVAGLLYLGVFVAVDGWQTRRDQAAADREQVTRIVERQKR